MAKKKPRFYITLNDILYCLCTPLRLGNEMSNSSVYQDDVEISETKAKLLVRVSRFSCVCPSCRQLLEQ